MRTFRKRISFAVAALCLPGPLAGQEQWYPSRYGAEDTLGAVNNLSPEGMKRAARLVEAGKVYSLAIVTGPDTPAFGDRRYSVRITPPSEQEPRAGDPGVSAHEEVVTSSMGIGTQIDGLAHIGIDGRFYNGRPGSELNQPGGLRVYDSSQIPPIVSRGVLIDMARYFGTDMVKPGMELSSAHIKAAMRAQKVNVGKGDVVLLHTGWMRMIVIDKARYASAWPGLGEDGANFLSRMGVVAVGLDTIGIEPRPLPGNVSPAIAHQTFLAKHGVYPLECINTADLVADSVSEFMFVLGVPRFQGTAQMVINPIAIR